MIEVLLTMHPFRIFDQQYRDIMGGGSVTLGHLVVPGKERRSGFRPVQNVLVLLPTDSAKTPCSL